MVPEGERTIRNIRITVTNDQFEKLDDAKGDRTWREAMMEDMVGETIEESDEENDEA